MDKFKGLDIKILLSLHRFMISDLKPTMTTEKPDERERKKRCFWRKTLWETGSKLTVYNHRPRVGPWMSMTSSFPFFTFKSPYPMLFGWHPKKTKAIISIQFAPSLCRNTDRLSYFGHAPRGELWEAEGQINGYYHSHQLITEHLDPGASTQTLNAEGIPTPGEQNQDDDWQLVLTLSHLNLRYIAKHWLVSSFIICSFIKIIYINTSAFTIKAPKVLLKYIWLPI